MDDFVLEITPDNIHGRLLVDVREIDEWHAGHAPNAIHVPLSEIQNGWTPNISGCITSQPMRPGTIMPFGARLPALHWMR